MTASKDVREPGPQPTVPSTPGGRGIVQALLALLILAGGVAAVVILIKMKKPPQRVEQEVRAPLVEARQIHAGDIPMVVQGYGTVTPKVEVELIPEVAGKVVFVHSELKAGGVIGANEKIVKIDPRDYELAVQQAQASVAEAQVRLDTEIAEADVARREWRQLHPEMEPDSPLVLRGPQIRRAQAGLESAQAQLAMAELKLERTSISLPFDVLIVSEKVDLGQFLGAGQPLGVAYGVDAFEIEVPLEDGELAWFDAFASSSSPNGRASDRQTPVEVKAEFAGDDLAWQGYVTRTTGQVDRASRMVPVVVEVPNPLEMADGKPPLLPGAFVQVRIAGRTLKNALAVPRDAIHGGKWVYLVNDNTLHIASLDIVRTDQDFAYTTSGVPDGALIVTSTLDIAVEGMAVRIESEETPPGEAQ